MQGFFVNNFGGIAFDFAYNFLPFTERAKIWHFFCVFLRRKPIALIEKTLH